LSLSVGLFAQNQVTYVYEDNSGNNGKVEWTRTVEIPDAEIGVPKTVKIPVKNISKEPLLLLFAKTHCGCTDAMAQKEAIAPGETGYVEVTFTAKARMEGEKMIPPPFSFYQIIDVTTNFDKVNSVLLSVQGMVVK
jgi:Protein of unknown function (DUF1573)